MSVTASPSTLVILAFVDARGADAAWALVRCDASSGEIRLGTGRFSPEDEDAAVSRAAVAQEVLNGLSVGTVTAAAIYTDSAAALAPLLRDLLDEDPRPRIALREIAPPARVQALLDRIWVEGSRKNVAIEGAAPIDVAALRASWQDAGAPGVVL